MILSGDHQKAVEKIAKKLEIQNYQASCLPEDKMKTIENLSKNYKVLFVGDGVNDALALKYASVSMTLREGSDLAIESSDVLLLKNDLLSLKKPSNYLKIPLKLSSKILLFLCFIMLVPYLWLFWV